MKYVIVNDPLKPQSTDGLKAVATGLNIAEAILRQPIGIKLEVVDLSGTFDLGCNYVFIDGQSKGFVNIAVF